MPRILAILVTLLAITLVVVFFNYRWITSVEEGMEDPQGVDEFHVLDRLTDLRKRLQEMLRIKKSVNQELRVVESELRERQVEVQSRLVEIDQLKLDLRQVQDAVQKYQVSLDQLKLTHEEASRQNQPYLSRPLRLVANELINYKSTLQVKPKLCSMNSCFDYSRCSITSGFPVYFYEPKSFLSTTQQHTDNISLQQHTDNISLQSNILSQVKSFIRNNVYKTSNALNACIHVVIISASATSQNTTIGRYLRGLEYWSQGLNHVVINLSPIPLHSLSVDKAILVQSSFDKNSFRKRFDMIISVPETNIVQSSQHCPARRQFLACFRGNLSHFPQVKNVMNRLKSVDDFLFDLDSNETSCREGELEKSTFSLILASQGSPIDSFRNSLAFGSIPIILGGHEMDFPFDESVDWSLVSILIPMQRVSEVHVIMKSLSDPDVTEMRRMGKVFLERFLWNVETVMSTCLALLRQKRLQIPAAPVIDSPTIPLYSNSSPIKYLEGTEFNMMSPESAEAAENLGPVEPPFPSPAFGRNISLTLSRSYSLWNDPRFDPFTLFPHTPFDPLLPSEAKFLGSSFGFRPIGRGSGGSGKEFSLSLGGNVPREQFTILLLTYERESVLLDSLIRLKGLPYLNKIIVIWNHPHKRPSDEMAWPKLDAPIHVIQAEKNSLNNRFKPYDAIQTEAVLSIDDDTHLRHDEIIFGFRFVHSSSFPLFLLFSLLLSLLFLFCSPSPSLTLFFFFALSLFCYPSCLLFCLLLLFFTILRSHSLPREWPSLCPFLSHFIMLNFSPSLN